MNPLSSFINAAFPYLDTSSLNNKNLSGAQQAVNIMDPRNQANNQQVSFPGVAQNIGTDVGNIAGGLAGMVGRGISDVSNLGQLSQDVTNAPANIGKFVGGTASFMNNALGQPIATDKNGNFTGVQPISPVEALQTWYKNPVSTALAAQTAAQGLGAIQGKFAPPTDDNAPDNPNPVEKAGNTIQENTRQIKLPASIGGAQDEADVNGTLNKLGFQGSAADQYGQLQPAMDNLNDYIQNKSSMATNPQNVPIDEATKAIQDAVNKQFPINGPESDVAQQTVNNYINRLYDAARQPNPAGYPGEGLPPTPEGGGSPLDAVGQPGGTAPMNGYPSEASGDVNPASIDTPTLYQMKVIANQATSDIFKKLDNGQPLSDLDKVTLAGRNALDDVITKYHPDVKGATTDMSNLYDAAPSLDKARFAGAGGAVNVLGTTVPGALVRGATNAVGSVLQNGGGKLGGVMDMAKSVMAPTLVGAGQMQNNNASLPGNDAQDTTSPITDTGNQPGTGVVSSGQRYSIASPQSQGLATTIQDYTTKVQAAQKLIETEKLNNPEQASIDQGKLDAWQTQYQTQQPIVTAYTNSNQILGYANQAYSIAKDAAPNLLSLNGTFDSLRKSTDPKYTQLYGALQALQTQTGVNLAASKTKADLLANIDQAASIANTNYQAILQQQIGGNTLNPGNTNVSLPATPASIPQGQVGQPVHYNFNFGKAGEGMPATPPAFQ